jgi:hypothetical protein
MALCSSTLVWHRQQRRVERDSFLISHGYARKVILAWYQPDKFHDLYIAYHRLSSQIPTSTIRYALTSCTSPLIFALIPIP